MNLSLHNRKPAVPAVLAVLAALIGVLAACAPVPAPPDDSNVRVGATQPAPDWIESGAPITLDNVASVAYLGRLDQQVTPTTVFAYSISPDATRLAGLTNEQLIIWDLLSGGLLAFTARSGATHVYYAPDKTEVYTLDPNGRISIYETERAVLQNSIDAVGSFSGAQVFYGEDGWLALGSTDGQVKVWDVVERTSLVTLEAHRASVSVLAFDAAGERLATGGDDGQIKVWDWQTRTLLHTFLLPADTRVVRTAFSPDGAQLAVGTDVQILLYTLADETLAHTLTLSDSSVDDALAYSPDGQYLVSGGRINALSLWSPATGELLARLPGVSSSSAAVAFAPDGAMMLSSALDVLPRLWRMNAISEGTAASADIAVGDAQIIASDWTSDGRLLVLFDATGPVHLWGIPATTTAAAS